MSRIERGAPLEEQTLVPLLERAQRDQDADAFDGLYLLYADRIFRYLLARGCQREDAEELTSALFLRLIERIGQYRIAPADNVAIFSAWLYRIARNRMIDVHRVRQRRRLVPIEDAGTLPDRRQPIQELERRIDQSRLLERMASLNEAQREVLVLRFLEGHSLAETARLIDKSEGAVKGLQHRALRTLRLLITDEAGLG